MKFASISAAFFALALPVFAQTQQTVTYDTRYDDASLPLTEVACSDGSNGLITQGYTTLGSLPTFPNIGGAYTVNGWNSPACGTCYQLTYNGVSIYVLVVDYCAEGFNISEEAMNTLTGGQGIDLGRVEATATQVDVSYCKL